MDAPTSKDDKILDTSFKSDVFEPSTSTPAVSIKISNHIDLKDTVKYTEYDEDDEDDDDDDEDEDDEDDEDDENIEQNPQENDEEYDNSSKTVEMCFSPPQSNRTLKKNSKHKKQKPKKPNLKKRNKNQQLINSATNIKQNEEALSLADSVSSLQEDTNSLLNGSSSSVVVSTSSAPPTASIQSNPSKLYDWNSRTLNSSASNTELSNLESKTKNSSKKLEKSSDLDPFEREEIFNKINVLLKLALKNHQLKPNQPVNEHASVPPTTPATAAIQNANRSLSSGLDYPRSSYHYTAQSSFNSQLQHSKPVYCSSMSQVDESVKKTVAENVWKHIYDFFVHFDNRAENDEEIDRRIREAQSIIPITIDDILNTNFSPVTQNMNDEIYNNMRTPSDYSYLYERKIYIDQLCYLYWLVEDELNRIGYVESLYPSIRLLRKSQPAYADPKFEASTKTLLLWYKIMKDLMNSCDILGKFLGFARETKPENLQYWTWFDKRLSYSKMEYENVQKWLNENFSNDNDSKSLNQHHFQHHHHHHHHYNHTESSVFDNSVNSPSIRLTKPTFKDFKELDQMSESTVQAETESSRSFLLQPGVGFPFGVRLQANKNNRQVSFELKASKSTNNLLYNNFDSPSVYESYGLDNTSIDTANISVANDLSTISSGSCNDKAQQMFSQELAQGITNLINSSENGENEHLKKAKLHHLSSFISRSSSFRSNESPSSNHSNGLSSSFYNSLIDLQSSVTTMNSRPNVEFNLNETADSEPVVDNSKKPPQFSSLISQISSVLGDHHEPAGDVHKNNSDFSTINDADSSNRKQTPQDSNVYTNRQKIFNEFLHKRLRKHGLTKTCDEIRKVVLKTIPNALYALQIDKCERTNSATCEDHLYYHLMPLHFKCANYINQFPYDEEIFKFGIRSEAFKRLDLPSFRPLYLYLMNVILDLMHMCIRMQIENKRDMKVQSSFKFSLMSIEVLTNECRECIEQAILVRQFYYHMVYSVFEKSELDVQSALENDLVKFDEDLKEIIDIYLTYTTDWVHDLIANLDLSKALNVLKVEWDFCKNNLYFVTSSEDMYAKRFCTMCCFIHKSLCHNLSYIDTKHKQPLMEYVTSMEMCQDNSLDGDEDQHKSIIIDNDYSDQEDTDNQELESSLKRKESNNSSHNSETCASHTLKHKYSIDSNSFDANLKCNEFKEEMNQLRKRCMKALGFCASLISDLELAAKYEVKSSIQNLLNELKSANYVLVSFTNPELKTSYTTTPNSSLSSLEHKTPPPLSHSHSTPGNMDSNEQEANSQAPSFMIFVPQEFSRDKTQIVRLLFIISEKDDHETVNSGSTNSSALPEPNTSEKQTTSRQNSSIPSEHHASPVQKVACPVRRLSSSNSFLDFNSDNQFTSCLNKLSRMANMTNLNKISSSGHTSPTHTSPTTTFLISPISKNDGYLLYLQLPKKSKESWKWEGASINLYASISVRRSLYQHKNVCDPEAPINLILVTPKQKILQEKKLELKTKLKGTISLVKEKTSFHPNIELAIDDLKDSVLELRKEVAACIQSIEKDLKNSVHYESDSKYHTHKIIDQRYLSEIWRVSYNLGIELQNECIKFMTQDRSEQFSIGLAEFAIMWCNYIIDKTEKGKGRTVRPWAAKKGIQLLQEAVQHSAYLKNELFCELSRAIEKCILHVIGVRSGSGSSKGHLSPEVFKSRSNYDFMHHDQNLISDRHRKSVPQLYDEKETTRSSCSNSSSIYKKRNKVTPPSERFSKGCNSVEKSREDHLLEKRYIGKILGQQRTQHVITATEVNFRWQLGLLIGEGNYGRVFSCVNLESGEPMAMKEIPFKSNDVEKIKKIADEINNVQGINHENLVKFYGAELHRKEILIFMEFCGDQCTLDRISREASGLPETIVRNYTKSLLSAVEHLHENDIMHRDIKGANIFLKSIDPKNPDKVVLKLGDFGCSIKFKDTIGSGKDSAKATGFMGTFSFMAPEVMTSVEGSLDGGYTYTADIWSLGCVVIEMFTGKRPWHPLSDEGIMWKVHIEMKQKKPPYPLKISQEGSDFLDKCLEFDPTQRQTADRLLDHTFVRVAVHNEYESI